MAMLCLIFLMIHQIVLAMFFFNKLVIYIWLITANHIACLYI